MVEQRKGVPPMAKAARRFKVIVLNAENLFVFMDKWDGTPVEGLTEHQWQFANAGLLANKEIKKIRDLAGTLKRLDPDLVLLTEVGGLVSLENFNRHFLGGAYGCHLAEGNSDRGIDMGFLLKAPWSAHLQSHREHPLEHPKYTRFSRDVLLLSLTRGDRGPVWFHTLLVHLKSKLNMRGEDFEGRTRRALEVRALAHLAQTLDPTVPLLLGGDFNGHARLPDPEPEFLPLYQLAQLTDAVELSPLPEEERFSYVYFRSGTRICQQLDYLFLNPAAQALLVSDSVQFPRWFTAEGQLLPVPALPEQRKLLPSDHFPLYAEFDLERHPLA